MKVAVLGGAGFIGSEVVKQLLEKGNEVVCIDSLEYSGNLNNLKRYGEKLSPYFHKDFTFLEMDISKINKYLVPQDVTHIINCAAHTHNDRVHLDKKSNAMSINASCLRSLLDICKERNMEKFLQVSTDEIYGSITDGGFKETDPIAPRTFYSASKAAGELVCNAHFIAYGTPVVITRGCNTFGNYQYPEKLIPLTTCLALQDIPITVYGNGSQKREWMHVSDHAIGIIAALEKGLPGQAYNLGSGIEKSNKEIVTKILSILDKQYLYREVEDPRKNSHDSRYFLDSNKAKNVLGWVANRSLFIEDIENTVDWYRNNPGWWKETFKKESFREYLHSMFPDIFNHSIYEQLTN